MITVAGDGSDRLFYLHDFGAAGEDVVFSGLTLTGGNAIGDDGGAVYSLTGALYAADLTIRSSVLSDNGPTPAAAPCTSTAAPWRSRTRSSAATAPAAAAGHCSSPTPPPASRMRSRSRSLARSSGATHTDSWGGAFYFEEPQGSAVIS